MAYFEVISRLAVDVMPLHFSPFCWCFCLGQECVQGLDWCIHSATLPVVRAAAARALVLLHTLAEDTLDEAVSTR